MQEDLIDQGIELMLFGMGTVIVFLTLLVLATLLMSYLVQRFLPEEAPASPGRAGTAPGPDRRLIAVISAAILQHRSRRK